MDYKIAREQTEYCPHKAVAGSWEGGDCYGYGDTVEKAIAAAKNRHVWEYGCPAEWVTVIR